MNPSIRKDFQVQQLKAELNEDENRQIYDPCISITSTEHMTVKN